MSPSPDKRTERPTSRISPTSHGGIHIQRKGKPVSGVVGSGSTAYLLVDCSGSMAGEKLEQAKRGATAFVKDAQAKGYSVGLVTFASSASIIREPQQATQGVQESMNSMVAGGTTDMAEGIEVATRRLRILTGPRALVVVTDGRPDSERDAIIAADQAKAEGIDIITIGTDDADRVFLATIASRTELVVMVGDNQLEQGIASAARMLPPGNS